MMTSFVTIVYSLVLFGFMSFKCSVFCSKHDSIHDSSSRCSVFDFEQKLLEKLVRMEMKIDAMELNIEQMDKYNKANFEKVKSKQNMTDTKVELVKTKLIQEIEFERDKTVNNSEKLHKRITKVETSIVSKIDTVETNFDKYRDLVRNDITWELEKVRNESSIDKPRVFTELSKLTKRLDTKDEDKIQDVFEASGLTKDSNLKDSVIKFNKNVLNIGGGYDKATGIFTAQRAGTYLLTIQLCIESKKFVRAQIFVESKIIKSVEYKNDGSGYACVSSSGIAVLSKKNNAFVKCHSGSDSGDILHNNPGYTSFSGIKLF